MQHITDNRWAPGASGASPPEGAPALYSARWIDRGTHGADIVWDRQGYAWNDDADRQHLADALVETMPHRLVGDLPVDRPFQVLDRDDVELWARRRDGYVYVDAWLVTP